MSSRKQVRFPRLLLTATTTMTYLLFGYARLPLPGHTTRVFRKGGEWWEIDKKITTQSPGRKTFRQGHRMDDGWMDGWRRGDPEGCTQRDINIYDHHRRVARDGFLLLNGNVPPIVFYVNDGDGLGWKPTVYCLLKVLYQQLFTHE